MKFSEWYADNECEVRQMIDTALHLRLSADQIMDLVKVNLHVAYTCGGTAALKSFNTEMAKVVIKNPDLTARESAEPKVGDPAYYTLINGKPIDHGKDAQRAMTDDEVLERQRAALSTAPSIEWLTKARVWDAERDEWRDA